VSSSIDITCPEDLFELDASDLSCPPAAAQAVADQTGPSGNTISSVAYAGRDEQSETPRSLADGVRKAHPVADISLTSTAPNSTAEKAHVLIVE
jgi:hypothetical protein